MKICSFIFIGIVPDMETAPGLAPPIPPARGLDLEYEIEGKAQVKCRSFHVPNLIGGLSA